MSELKTDNRMPLRSYLQRQQAPIDFISIKDKSHGAFACGGERGYVSPRVMDALRANSAGIDDIEYAEVTKPGETNAVPCLMLKSKANILKTFSLE